MTVLLVVMILGFLTIVGLFVMRLAPEPTPNLTSIELPEGVTALTYTRGPDWYAIVGDDNMIRIYNLDQTLRQEIEIQPAQ